MFSSLVNADFYGTISVSHDSVKLYQKAFGFSEMANEIPNEVDTRFGTASAGKVFVAVAILQLIENGQLRFDSKLGDLLEISLNKIDPSITVEQLLNHTSGIPDYFDETVMDDYAQLWIKTPNYRIRKSSDLLPLFIKKSMRNIPGEKFTYNNSGYVMLGLIIEALTGEPFDVYIHQNIFISADMKHAGYFELDRLPAKCAQSYVYDTDNKCYYTNIYSIDAKGTGAGGAFLTEEDVEKFWHALVTGRLISLEMLEKMFTRQSGDSHSNYGYGVWLKKTSDEKWVPFIQGSDPGISFVSRYHPDSKLLITILSNKADNVWQLAKKIENVLFG